MAERKNLPHQYYYRPKRIIIGQPGEKNGVGYKGDHILPVV
jgi:hypothetical protein